MLLRNANRTRRSLSSGFSLIEVLMTMALIGILGALATGGYSRYAVRAHNASAVKDIGKIFLTIGRYRLNHYDAVPGSLAEIGMDQMLDPWGNPYVYFPFSGAQGNGGKRKDHNLVPINSDFDLYSMGPDEQSSSPLTAKASRDDIIMANDGKYIGIASDY